MVFPSEPDAPPAKKLSAAVRNWSLTPGREDARGGDGSCVHAGVSTPGLPGLGRLPATAASGEEPTDILSALLSSKSSVGWRSSRRNLLPVVQSGKTLTGKIFARASCSTCRSEQRDAELVTVWSTHVARRCRLLNLVANVAPRVRCPMCGEANRVLGDIWEGTQSACRPQGKYTSEHRGKAPTCDAPRPPLKHLRP